MMSELRLANVAPVDAITTKVWSLFNILRSEHVSSDDYYFVLFLISIYKDGYFEDILSTAPDEVKYLIERRLYNSNGIHRELYSEIYKAFDHSLKQVSNMGLISIFQLLTSIDLVLLKQHFADIFDNTLYRIAKSQGRHAGEFIQPVEITRLVCNLADLPKNSRIFNPFAGVASFAVLFDKDQNYFGQEINYTTWAIGTLRIMAYEKSGSSTFVKDNSILNWPSDNHKFDLVVSNPPYNLRLSNKHRELFPKISTAEQFFIEKGITSLTHKGKLIAIFPIGFLFRGGQEQRLREHLIETDLIEFIIALPGGLLLNSGIPLVVLVLNKAKSKPGYVKFIDAKNHVESIGSREKRLNDYTLYSIVKNDHDSDSSRTISIEHIREFGYNLNVPRYFQKDFAGVKLAEILEPVRGNRNGNIQNGKLIRVRDLKDDKIDYSLDEKTIEHSELKRKDIRLIEESALLLAVRWRTLKPTLFRYQGNPILLSPDILAFKVNESLANVQYLINELHSEYVQEQLGSYRIGDAIPFIRRNDLLEIKIELPALKEQNAKVQGLEESSNRIKALQQEIKALTHGESSSRFNEFASLKHTLGRPRQNILDWSDNLLHFLGGKGPEIEKINKAFAEFYEIDIMSALNEIKRDINFMSEILEKGENGLAMIDYPLQLVSLSDINALISLITHNGFKFKLKKLLMKGEKLKERGIKCNPLLLTTLLDNILTNANKHGFTEKDPANEVVIELTEVDGQLILEVKNNGKPFPKNFDKEKFISKYSTANPQVGSGLGGYDINRIAEYFYNPNWELILAKDPIYPVKFKFQFPLKFVK